MLAITGYQPRSYLLTVQNRARANCRPLFGDPLIRLREGPGALAGCPSGGAGPESGVEIGCRRCREGRQGEGCECHWDQDAIFHQPPRLSRGRSGSAAAGYD